MCIKFSCRRVGSSYSNVRPPASTSHPHRSVGTESLRLRNVSTCIHTHDGAHSPEIYSDGTTALHRCDMKILRCLLASVNTSRRRYNHALLSSPVHTHHRFSRYSNLLTIWRSLQQSLEIHSTTPDSIQTLASPNLLPISRASRFSRDTLKSRLHSSTYAPVVESPSTHLGTSRPNLNSFATPMGSSITIELARGRYGRGNRAHSSCFDVRSSFAGYEQLLRFVRYGSTTFGFYSTNRGIHLSQASQGLLSGNEGTQRERPL
ncbi:hypothetical protein K474DRAFT_197174 [Panus rudis PR-1116 ss-1]|nr:hypothetical protein K474DRAFT_197174 [Panus rudis PR-1116 ss-1]